MITVGAIAKQLGNKSVAFTEGQLDYISPISIGGLKSLGTPYMSGQSFILFTYVPPQIRDVTDVASTGTKTDVFFKFMEKTFQEVSGISDISLEVEAMTGGFTGINHNFPSSSSYSTEEITLNFQAMSGNLYRAPIQAWLTGIRDPRTGLYSLPTYGGVHQYSVDMLYLNTNPSVGSKNSDTRKASLEFSALFDSMFPKNVPLSHFNYSKNSHSHTDLSINFNCEMVMGSNVDKIAAEVLASDWFFNRYILPAQKYHTNRPNSGVLSIGESPESVTNNYDSKDITYKYFVIDDDAGLETTV